MAVSSGETGEKKKSKSGRSRGEVGEEVGALELWGVIDPPHRLFKLLGMLEPAAFRPKEADTINLLL